MIQQFHFWVYMGRKWNHYLEDSVHRNIIHNSQAMETTQVFISGWMDKENVVYI